MNRKSLLIASALVALPVAALSVTPPVADAVPAQATVAASAVDRQWTPGPERLANGAPGAETLNALADELFAD